MISAITVQDAIGTLDSDSRGRLSDGFHTFNELYDYRKIYNAMLFNEWFKNGLHSVHKSLKHSDGNECFGGGWFIVMATIPTGQISNHYEIKDWDLFNCEIRDVAEVYDGHTPKEAYARMVDYTYRPNGWGR